MNPFRKDKIMSYYKDALDIVSGKMVYPRMALIYPTYACNYNCPHCLCKELNTTRQSYPYKELRSLVLQLKKVGVKGIEFCGGGEPTMYPHFEGIVKFITDNGIEFGILTNGSVLDKYYKLLMDRATYVRVSMDTIDEETFEKMHRPPHGITINKIMGNIYNMAHYKKDSGSKCLIGVKALISRHNYYEIKAMVEYVTNSNIDYIQFKGVRSDDSELTEGEKKIVNEEIQSYKSDKVRGDVNATTLKTPCFMSPIHTMIDPYGDVYICCYYQYRKDSHKIGNVIENRFKHIWFSDKHKQVIKNIKMSECNKYDCRWHGYNEVMGRIIKSNDLHINFI